MTDVFKLVVVGPGAVGKTACITSFVSRKFFDDLKVTIGMNLQSKTVERNSKTVTVQLWDLAGQDRFGLQRTMYYRGLRGLILMVDLTRPDSLSTAKKYLLEEIQPATEGQDLKCVAVVGNKVDLADMITVSDNDLTGLAKLAEDTLGRKTFTIKTSAMELTEVDEMFHTLIDCVVESTE